MPLSARLRNGARPWIKGVCMLLASQCRKTAATLLHYATGCFFINAYNNKYDKQIARSSSSLGTRLHPLSSV